MMMAVVLLLGVVLVAFALGSIPWGLIISSLFYKTDIRTQGSGNIGTTNALRTLGKRGGAAVFLLDFGKGLLAGFLAWLAVVYLGPLVGGLGLGSGLDSGSGLSLAGGQSLGSGLSLTGGLTSRDVLTAAFAGCTFGHIFSPWLKFKGGKGIAVAVGCQFITFGWPWAVLELGIFIVLVLATRHVSVGSIAAAIACPLIGLGLFWGDWLSVAFCAAVGFIIIWAHRENIKRLYAGTESRLGRKADT
jgi:glycerol-3-phosphate acyltransferase PlsY